MGLSTIKLMTNNPDKVSQLAKYGVVVEERIGLSLPTNPHNHDYMQTKITRTGHQLIHPDKVHEDSGISGARAK